MQVRRASELLPAPACLWASYSQLPLDKLLIIVALAFLFSTRLAVVTLCAENVPDECQEEVYQYIITRGKNINANIPLGRLECSLQVSSWPAQLLYSRYVCVQGSVHCCAGLNHNCTVGTVCPESSSVWRGDT